MSDMLVCDVSRMNFDSSNVSLIGFETVDVLIVLHPREISFSWVSYRKPQALFALFTTSAALARARCAPCSSTWST